MEDHRLGLCGGAHAQDFQEDEIVITGPDLVINPGGHPRRRPGQDKRSFIVNVDVDAVKPTLTMGGGQLPGEMDVVLSNQRDPQSRGWAQPWLGLGAVLDRDGHQGRVK